MARNPYHGLPAQRFWPGTGGDRQQTDLRGLYPARFTITRETRIATAGSCFAQHIHGHLRQRGYNVLDAEPPPPGLRGADAARYGFGVFSARWGNIYTARQLRELLEEALSPSSPGRTPIWERGNRFVDALRPSVEPDGLDSAEQVRRHREQHLAHVRRLLEEVDVFVFTLGLTEAWVDLATARVVPAAPGVLAGEYEPHLHRFVNFGFRDVYDDMVEVIRLLKRRSPDLKVLLSVSPVALAATASNDHVIVANTFSKAVLRAVAGQLAAEREDVDYFPSYELISQTASRSDFYMSDLRQVSPAGIAAAMGLFVAAHELTPPASTAWEQAGGDPPSAESAACEDALLAAFGP